MCGDDGKVVECMSAAGEFLREGDLRRRLWSSLGESCAHRESPLVSGYRELGLEMAIKFP